MSPNVDITISAATGITIDAHFPTTTIAQWDDHQYRAIMEALGVLADIGIDPTATGSATSSAFPGTGLSLDPPDQPDLPPAPPPHTPDPPADLVHAILRIAVQQGGTLGEPDLDSELVPDLATAAGRTRVAVKTSIATASKQGLLAIVYGTSTNPKQITVTDAGRARAEGGPRG